MPLSLFLDMGFAQCCTSCLLQKLAKLLEGSMEGRVMYVVPFSMGPPGSLLARYGVQITDHPYVAASLSLVTRTGTAVLKHLGNGGT